MCWNKRRLCWKIAKLFYFCHLKKLVRPETFGSYYVYQSYSLSLIDYLISFLCAVLWFRVLFIFYVSIWKNYITWGYKSANSFRVTAPTFTRPQSFRLLSAGTLRIPSVFSSSWNQETLLLRICVICQTIRTAPKPLKACDSPWSDVPMHALIQVGDIFSICFE